MAPFGFVSLLLFVASLVVQILNCAVFSSKFPIIFGVNFILMCNFSNVKISINNLYYLVKVNLLSKLSNVMASINNLYYLVKVTLLSLNTIILCNLSNVMISINNLYYLVKLTLSGAAASCEVPNSNLAAVLSSSLFAVFLTFFPISKFPAVVVGFFFCPTHYLFCSGSKFLFIFCVCLTILHNLSNVAMAIILVSNNLCCLVKLMLLVQLPLAPNSKLSAVPFFPNSKFLFVMFCSKFQLLFAGLLLLPRYGSVCPLSQL